MMIDDVFQSTLPGWGATCPRIPTGWVTGHFNPRSPDGERLHDAAVAVLSGEISIHAPRMGSDCTTSNPTRTV